MTITGIDIGYVATGIVIMDTEREELIEAITIRTKKDTKKKGLRQADDDLRRCREMAEGIIEILRKYPGLIAVELPHGGSKAAGARPHRCMGMATGILGAILSVLEYPADFFTPAECKKATTGNKNASKTEVRYKIIERFGNDIFSRTKVENEHQYDAASSIVACMKYSEMYRMINRKF